MYIFTYLHTQYRGIYRTCIPGGKNLGDDFRILPDRDALCKTYNLILTTHFSGKVVKA